MAERKEDPMLIKFDKIPKEKRWQKCLDELRENYTMSVREACKILKCDRSWVQKYVRPNVHYIYLSSGKGKGKINYVYIAGKLLQREMKESVWLHTKEFKSLIKENMSCCSRQTINIPIEYVIAQDKIREFQAEYRRIETGIQQCMERGDFLKLNKLKGKREDIIKGNLSEVGKIIYEKLPSKYKRTKTEAVVCEIPQYDLNDLIAAHDLKEYGDTDEEVHRSLFEEGCFRMELNLKDKTGKVSKKVYYLEPKERFPERCNSVGNILIGYAEYLKFLK